MVRQSVLLDYIIFGELKKSKFILKIFLTKVKHYCIVLLTHLLFHLHTLCGAYKPDFVVYGCLCIKPSLQLPDGLQSVHILLRIPVFD